MLRVQNIRLPLNYTENTLLQSAAKELRVPVSSIKSVTLRKRSVDARKKPEIYYAATVDAAVKKENLILKRCRNSHVSMAPDTRYQYPDSGIELLRERPVVAGSGPAGLFCGLMLARCGYRPVILERGEDVDARTKTVERFWATGQLNPVSNVQFGEGGAGTFSDGKLNTMVKDAAGRNRYVLETFVQMGASPEILYLNKPHIGTDVLRTVVKNLRKSITDLGGEIYFLSEVTDLHTENGKLQEIEINHSRKLPCQVLILAIGHSARDTFALLHKRGVEMTAKSFAVGLRVEHPQEMLNNAMYGMKHHPLLGAADYKVTAKLPGGRGVYSFCMCPGGYVVNASSEEKMTAVNGMSYHARDGQNANSAIIVTVTPGDFGHPGVLGGVEFQRDLERFAYQAGGGKVPVQRFDDFRANRRSLSLGDISPCIKGGWELANLREGLPGFLGDSLERGILQFENIIEGFSRPDTLLSGVESRTSSPVKILRNAEFEANIKGIYPCGEGAGYAGGITSAAMDGIKTAEAVIKKYRKF